MCNQPELQNFLLLSKRIHTSFDSNEIFWCWYVYYVFNCEVCLHDGYRLQKAINSANATAIIKNKAHYSNSGNNAYYKNTSNNANSRNIGHLMSNTTKGHYTSDQSSINGEYYQSTGRCVTHQHTTTKEHCSHCSHSSHFAIQEHSTCFWKKECSAQLANKRMRRQWNVKFSNRVLVHQSVPIKKIRRYNLEKIHLNITGAEHARIHTTDSCPILPIIDPADSFTINPMINQNGNSSYRESVSHRESAVVPFPRKPSIGEEASPNFFFPISFSIFSKSFVNFFIFTHCIINLLW